jgi:hypothetical protein
MSASRRIAENPFLVLGLPTTASRLEIEREGQKLLGMLELGFAVAATYDTPLGPRTRTPELVRAAVATLRDPAKRLAAEVWARAPIAPAREPTETPTATGPAGWPEAPAALGWRPR